ncbi:RNA polymerase subunit AC19 [Diatrype stigma]|uniref:RNA polymerase subunit AC19 n=1 Tax=Diatrype stigma TaxID=117547 RepID=A0AAN9V9R9_9PEZI
MPGKTNLKQEEDAAMEDAPASAQKPTVESQEDGAEPMQEDGEDGAEAQEEEVDEEEVPKVRIATPKFQVSINTLDGLLSLTVPTEGTTATAALEKGLQDLEDLCDVVSEEFWTARNKFNESQA